MQFAHAMVLPGRTSFSQSILIAGLNYVSNSVDSSEFLRCSVENTNHAQPERCPSSVSRDIGLFPRHRDITIIRLAPGR